MKILQQLFTAWLLHRYMDIQVDHPFSNSD